MEEEKGTFDVNGFTIHPDIFAQQIELDYLTNSFQSKEIEQSWNEILKKPKDKQQEKVTELRNSVLSHGIPDTVRTNVWMYLLNSSNIEEYQKHVEIYRNLPPHHEITEQIHLDLQRTFPEHKWFQENGEEAREVLERVAGAYSVIDIHDGYCQSLNFLAAFILVTNHKQEVLFLFFSFLFFIN